MSTEEKPKQSPELEKLLQRKAELEKSKAIAMAAYNQSIGAINEINRNIKEREAADAKKAESPAAESEKEELLQKNNL